MFFFTINFSEKNSNTKQNVIILLKVFYIGNSIDQIVSDLWFFDENIIVFKKIHFGIKSQNKNVLRERRKV